MLAYDKPVATEPVSTPLSVGAAGFGLGELLRLLWRRRIAIAAAAMLGAVGAVAVGKSLTPRYTATAQLYVDPRELQLVDRELTPRNQDGSGLPMIVESQARLITSNSVLFKVIESEKLEDDGEFGQNAGGGLLGAVGLGSPPTAETRRNATLDTLTRHIVVRRTDRTFIVEIDVWSREPVKAAKLANAIATAYLEETVDTQSASARRATADLSARLKEMQERLRKAENALADYKAKNNFVGTQETLVSDQELSAITQRLAAARALALDAQAKYDQVEASRKAASDIGALPEALQSQTIANLRAQYADVRKRQAELTSELGPRHPALRNIDNQAEDLRRNISEEVNRIAQSAKTDLTRARTYEASLATVLESQKRQSNDMGLAAVRLRELERDVDASRGIYQSYLKRARETQEQETLNTSNARVIGEATPPQRRSFPPAMTLLAAIGFALGGLGGASGAVAIDRLTQPVRSPPPGEASPSLAVRPRRRNDAATPAKAPDVSLAVRPLIVRLQDFDVAHVPARPVKPGAPIDITRLGWPTLRPGIPLTPFTNAMRRLRGRPLPEDVAEQAGAQVLAIVSQSAGGRSMVALNVALAAARDGVDVLLIDADASHHILSDRMGGSARSCRSLLRRLNASREAATETLNRITLLPAFTGAHSTEMTVRAIAHARQSGRCGLIVLDGPALPPQGKDAELISQADGVIAVLPAQLDIDERMNAILHALGDARDKLSGVIINEVADHKAAESQDRAYA